MTTGLYVGQSGIKKQKKGSAIWASVHVAFTSSVHVAFTRTKRSQYSYQEHRISDTGPAKRRVGPFEEREFSSKS
jgi:hypothetical protein